MRNLSLLRTSHIPLPEGLPSTNSIAAVTLDLDEDVAYVAVERQTPDADVEVEVWKIGGVAKWESELLEDMILVTTSRFQSHLASNPWSASTKPSEVVSFKLLPDTRTLVLITRGGDIATASLDDEMPMLDSVGNVDAGILAASWSPDDSQLVLATGDGKLILMSATFDIISETALEPTDFGEDAPINVGWGSKQTQFHGSAGKAAAQAPRPALVGASPDDDALPRISWRGDGAFFAVSSLAPAPADDPAAARRRTLRMYSHAGALQSTGEPTPGLEHALAWRPSGNWIVSTQRYGFPGGGQGREGRHDLVMFERNGLRRGEFEIQAVSAPATKLEGGEKKWGYKVREVGWSADSNILSIWVEKDEGDVVQLWTTGNYHWYLKHEIVAPSPDGKPGRFTSMSWHPEDSSRIILTTVSEIIQRSYLWDTFASRSQPPNDSGSVAVLDGSQILLTPFRTQNVPPPMSSFQLPLAAPPADAPSLQSRVPVHVSFSPSKDILAQLWETGYVELTDLRTRLGPGRGKVMDPLPVWKGLIGDETHAYRQVSVLKTADESVKVVALGSGAGIDAKDVVVIASVGGGAISECVQVDMSHRNGRLVPSEDQILWQSPEGEILAVDASSESFSPSTSFPEFCAYTKHVSVSSPPSSLFVGLTPSGKLYAAAESDAHHLLAPNANSFTVASGFLVYTTTAHVSHYAPLSALASLLAKVALGESPKEEDTRWETRRVERGSRIATAVPSTMSLVLQMPRGNLETVNPRPLVMEIVKQDIDAMDYAKAFSSCRRHRIDMNVLVSHDRDAFMRNITAFVEQVKDVDYINLFLTSLGQGTLPDDIVNEVCDGVRKELEKKSVSTYINSILTAHVMKRPSDHEAGLAELLKLRESQPDLVEEAVKYIIFLVDANSLFDTALGMYDFSLVLMIAQHAQKDPREYLPFLRELRALDKFYQRFRIDDHLRRHAKALHNLSLAGEQRFAEALAYVEKHQLYEAALDIWRDTDKYQTVLGIYGDWLYERREFAEAAFVFRQAQKFSKAMLAYEKALLWQELFDVALQEDLPSEDLSAVAYRVAEDLSSKKRYQEAARVLLDYAKDVREAVIALVQGNQFSEARRVVTLSSKSELLEDIVFPGALETRAQIAEDLSEMRDQLRKQLSRIRELRVKKVEEPDAFYGTQDDNADLHNVDVMTDVSMAPTAFTRYTVAASAMSKASSKRSSRSKRKMERKVGSGRKGTVDEEEYLLRSVTKLVGRWETVKADATHLLPHLFQFPTPTHREEGLELQSEIAEFEQELRAAIDEIWTKTVPSPPPVETDIAVPGVDAMQEGWAKRMREYEMNARLDPLDKVVKPEVGKVEWKDKLARV
ncbi:IkappaB kinase complex IKAP component [Phanerochaete sordida]|uniref:Elongator complex protein 1 n=1 Tax=Phanerochaete sordida TaxID=48140 RepID=A0A9P3GNJ0_9APHY|nr:IkappaB kinase complex IKAP component [Phanerochaete sordida]